MRIIRNYQGVPERGRGSVSAIGNFDGVHLGHLKVLDIARECASRTGSELAVVTFEPHPRQHFDPDAQPFRLMNSGAKARRLQSLGVDLLFELPFDARLASLTSEQFARAALADGIGISCAVVGDDFRFGKGRMGNAAELTRFGAEFGFTTSIVPIVRYENQPFSSTSIRTALSAGLVGEAARILGHWHRIEGCVQAGQRRGREFGFPTANITLDSLHPPRFGIYASFVEILTGNHKGKFQGSASVGVRPTFGRNLPNLEIYIFDFAGDIYGEDISVALVEFQRPEIAFSSIGELVDQMKLDCQRSRELLCAHD